LPGTKLLEAQTLTREFLDHSSGRLTPAIGDQAATDCA
jgi:hypothetical protein